MSAVDMRATSLRTAERPQTPAGQPARAPDTWWYTLAYAETPLRERALAEDDLRALLETLRARDLPLPAELASSRASARRVGARYIWAFSSLRDALQAARATRRSDYRAYPLPATLREASLDRLYSRFPLAEFPRASVILFSGAPVCPDPLLSADPAPGSLGADLAYAMGPDLWDRFTLCGFQQGASLVRVAATDRWVRMAPRTLEEAWDAAERAARAPRTPESGDTPAPAPVEPEDMENMAFCALIRVLTGAASDEPERPAPHAGATSADAQRSRRMETHA